MIPAAEQQTSKKLISDASISVKGIDVGGNVQGHITVGNENVVGNDNIVLNVHDSHGAIVNVTQTPSVVRPLSSRGQPLRLLRGFTGRRDYLDQISGSIRSNEAVLVYGRDGIGKTSLLAQASNSDAALSKPEGVVALEGIDDEGRVLGKGDIIQRLFDALFESNPPLKVTSPTARPHLSNTQPLVLLDHLSIPMTDLHNLPDLFPKGALLIANENPPGDDRFLTIRLLPLTREESIQMFGSKSGFALEETTRPWIDKICDLLGDVPLAIAKTANYIREYGLTLREVAENLAAIQPPSQDRLQAAIERSFGLIYLALNKQERDMLAITAAAPGHSVDRPWLESVAGGEATSAALESLELLVANSPRLRLPDGIKQILQSGTGNPHAQRELLLRHLLDELKTRSLDFKFVEDELGNILGLLQWASNEGRWADVVALGRAVDPYLTLHGLWDAWESVLKQVLTAAQNLKDLAARGWALHQLGTREIGVGTKKQAINLLLRALKIRLSQGDMVGAAYTLHNLRLLLPPEPRDPNQPVDPPEPPTLWQNILDTTRDNPWVIPGILIGIVILVILLWPPLNLEIQANPIRYNQINQDIEYTYTVTKSGFRRLKGPITATDGEKLLSCPPIEDFPDHDDILEWGETMTCTIHYHITPDDMNNGSVKKTARARAEGSQLESPPASVTIYFDPKYLTLVKKADVKTYKRAGQKIKFTYVVRNAGDVSLEGPVTVRDDKIARSTPVSCPSVQAVGNKDGALDPGEFLACTATYTIQPADTHIDTCSVTNTAIASAGGINSEPESVTIYCDTGTLILSKSADREIYQEAGEHIKYTYIITNRGSKPLSGPVTVTDSVGDTQISVTCPNLSGIGNGDSAFDPDEILTCTAPYTITETDNKNCSVTNTAIASAGGINSEPESVKIYSDSPECGPIKLSLTKLADRETYDGDDKMITYTYVVSNGGSKPLSGPATVTDSVGDTQISVTCPNLSGIGNGDDFLNPDELLVCEGSYTIQRKDFDTCSVTNIAFASAGGVNSELESVTIYSDSPECGPIKLNLTKLADRETYRELGEVITYTYIITNPFKVPVKGPVTVDDKKISTDPIHCPELNTVGNHDDYLDPNDEEIRCTAEYPITQKDMDSGSVTNIAKVINAAEKIISNHASVTIYEKALELKKSAKTQLPDPKTYEKVGDPVLYFYAVTGRSKLPLRGRVIVIDDKITVNPDDCPAFNTTGNRDNYLDFGETITCTAPYSITQDDMDHGSVTNTATARVGDVISNPDTATITGVPKILLRKTADRTTNEASYGATYDEVNQKITYTYEITNTGNVTLSPPFEITDDHIHIEDNKPFICETDKQQLAPNDSVTCTKTYNITQSDFQAKFMPKSVTNTATATVIYGGKEITSTATATITCGPPTDWVPYTFQEVVKFEEIAKWYSDIPIVDFQKKNCWGSETPISISTGDVLYLPSIRTATIRGFISNSQIGIPLQILLVLRSTSGEIFSQADGSYEFSELQPGTYSIFQTPIILSPGEIMDPLNFTIIPQR
jgi:uncharacterized repeat protein (TIGR01451 family)